MNMTRQEIMALSADTLEVVIRRHNHLYWVENRPQIADETFDLLVERLRELRPDAPLLDAIGAAGGGIETAGWGDKFVHEVPMLSLDKAYNEESIQKWFDRFEGFAIASPKIDGLACSLRYSEDGRLVLAVTRGDGVRGEVITENAKRIQNIPKQIKAGAVEVRGEVYMPLSVFRAFSGDHANPRNLAAGGLKQKDPEQTARYQLRFFAYDLIGEELPSETQKSARLTALGFEAVEGRPVEGAQLQSTYDDFVDHRSSLDYETDGVVYRVDLTSEQARLGSTAHHPRYAIAYKYQGEAGVSRLTSVDWSVSRTGAINPVAVVEPVTLSGASVTRASLHNLAFLDGLGLSYGAEVMMMRRGGVIPHVERVTKDGDGGPIEIPTRCPCGRSAAGRVGDVLFCLPEGAPCRPAQLGVLRHFITAIECKGFGAKILEQLFDHGLVQELADFYTLTVEKLLPLDRMGEKLASKLVINMKGAVRIPLATFLRSLGINTLGKVSAKVVAKHFQTLESIRAAEEESIAGIYGLGELSAKFIIDGLKAQAEVIDNLLKYVEVLPEIPAPESDPDEEPLPFSGLSFLFTGAMETMKRKEAQTKVKELGGEAPGGVLKTLSYLVLGNKDHARFIEGWRSSKLKKVERYNTQGGNIQIVSEARFVEFLESGIPSDEDA